MRAARSLRQGCHGTGESGAATATCGTACLSGRCCGHERSIQARSHFASVGDAAIRVGPVSRFGTGGGRLRGMAAPRARPALRRRAGGAGTGGTLPAARDAPGGNRRRDARRNPGLIPQHHGAASRRVCAVEALLVSLRDRDRRIYPRRWDAALKRAPRRLHAASRERVGRLSGRKTQHAAGLLARGRRNAATRRKRQKGWLGRQDSNLGMAVPKTAALPLGDAPPMSPR